MGYELRRAMREALGPDVTGLQRAVALEIADDARDESRLSFATLDDLARWTGAKDVNVVRNALKRLAGAGWEFRVPLGVGKDGRTLYAVPGRRVTFKVPAFEGIATATPMAREGVAVAPSQGAGARSEGATARSQGAGATPFSSSPQVPSSLSPPPGANDPAGAFQGERENEAAPKKQTQPADKPTTAQQVVRASGAIQPDHEAAFIAWVVAKHQVRGPAFWRTAAPDIPELADAWRADKPDVPKKLWLASVPEWCGKCGGGANFARTNLKFRTLDGNVFGDPCPDCHPSMAAAA